MFFFNNYFLNVTCFIFGFKMPIFLGPSCPWREKIFISVFNYYCLYGSGSFCRRLTNRLIHFHITPIVSESQPAHCVLEFPLPQTDKETLEVNEDAMRNHGWVFLLLLWDKNESALITDGFLFICFLSCEDAELPLTGQPFHYLWLGIGYTWGKQTACK